MAQVIQIQNIAAFVGQTVVLRGWVYDRTDKGKLQFIQMRDGTGIVQCVAFQKDMNPHEFAAANSLTQESSLIITGVVRAESRAPGFPGGYEVGVTSLELIQKAEEYPITPKEHGIEFLMDNRHLWVRSRRPWAILRIRATVVRELRNWLDQAGFMLVDTPIITPSAGEDTTTQFEIDYFGEPAFLAQTGQLYNEANIAAFGKVYCFGPTFRAEKSKTRRHVMEFWMLEIEAAFMRLAELMEVEEQVVSHVVAKVLELHRPELAILERDCDKLAKITAPFPRLSYDDAIKIVQQKAAETQDEKLKQELTIEWGQDFGAPHEAVISERYDRPVFVHHYPTAARVFYMQPTPKRPEVCENTDLLAPEGYGEIIGGSERIYDLALLEKRMAEQHLTPENYRWYVDLRRYGSVPHSGFGLGLSRFLMWLCGLPHIREAEPYPRLVNRKYP